MLPPRAVRPALCTLLLVACSIGRDIPDVEVREGFIAAGRGVELFYRALGSGGDTLVVLHGGPGFSMDYLIDDLTPLAERHTLIFYDQRGSGRSTLVSDPISLDALRFVEDLEAVRAYFGQQRLTVLAHAWGAGVAAEYAVIHPDRVGRMIIFGAIPPYRASLEQAFSRLEASRDSATRADLQRWYDARLADPGDLEACRAYYALWFRPFYDDESNARRSRGDFCSGSRESLANRMHGVDRYTMASLGDWDWRPALRTLAARTLVIHGTADPMPLDGAREWVATLPDARLLVMDDAGHFPHVEEPDRFFDAVEMFLAGEWPEDVEER